MQYKLLNFLLLYRQYEMNIRDNLLLYGSKLLMLKPEAVAGFRKKYFLYRNATFYNYKTTNLVLYSFSFRGECETLKRRKNYRRLEFKKGSLSPEGEERK